MLFWLMSPHTTRLCRGYRVSLSTRESDHDRDSHTQAAGFTRPDTETSGACLCTAFSKHRANISNTSQTDGHNTRVQAIPVDAGCCLIPVVQGICACGYAMCGCACITALSDWHIGRWHVHVAACDRLRQDFCQGYAMSVSDVAHLLPQRGQIYLDAK
jgi:hypothetical protein